MSLYNIYGRSQTSRGTHVVRIIYIYYIVYHVDIYGKSTHNIMNIVQGGSPSTINRIFPLIMDLFKL